MMIIDLFISFNRTTFLDVILIILQIMIITAIVYFWEQDKFEVPRMKLCLVSLFLSFLNDIIWLGIWFQVD